MKRVFPVIWMLIFLGVVGLIISRWQINGWGSLAWVAAAFAIMIIRAPHEKRNKSNKITEQKEVSLEKALLMLVAVGGTFLPFIHLASGLLSFADYRLPDWTVVLGIVLLAPTFWLFWRSHADLGRNWSVTVELRDDHSLVTNGVYRRMRHPMYTALWMLFLLQPLFVQNWIAGLSGMVSFGLMYILRVPYEEAMMREQFGSAYDEYCARSGRVLPKLGA